ncbi:hypothetical protein SEEB0236_06775 [Salmonella enterica subsp. enterica serovar Bareilly str. CFSAN000236]|nr:phage tail component H-like protein [Salmonella enterica subsp. enterica serovar Bareilly str. 2780]KFS80536.1 hypothetical protein SEEB0236_06775 [Salmonella enterica subsp. enterica serovar Bareilly str. CFSAN000236]
MLLQISRVKASCSRQVSYASAGVLLIALKVKLADILLLRQTYSRIRNQISVIPNADGGVYRSAGLSQYSGSIVNRPTFFAFAKGAGVMGEAGPEAILPLRRGADGKLGVVAAGSGGMAMFAPEYNIEIHNDAGNGQIGPQALQAVYNIGKKAAIDFWQQQSRDGGIAGGG